MDSPAAGTWGPYWARWLDGSYTPAARWTATLDRDIFRQVLVLRETDNERGWLGRSDRLYWGCAL